MISNDVSESIDLYDTLYKETEKQQVSIITSKYIEDCIKDLEILSGKKTGDVIEAAIASYRMELFEKLRLRDLFIESINKL